MQTTAELLAVILVLLNFWLLGASRIGACIKALAMQAMIMNVLPLLHSGPLEPWMIAMVISSTAIKVGLLPYLLLQAVKKTGVMLEIEPIVGYTKSVMVGTAMLGLCAFASNSLKVPVIGVEQLLVPISLFTILTGAFLLVARRKALMQVLGFLVMENGVYLFGVSFTVSEPWLVQMGVMLDLLAAVFVMGIIIYHINREFDHIDIDRLSDLKD